MSYMHGVIATLGDTQHTKPAQSGSIPIYIGCAPTHLAANPAPINTPVLVSSYADALDKLGMAWNWSKFDLCEAVFAHFGRNTAVGPIVVINVFDAATMRASENTTASVVLSSGSGSFIDEDCVLSTLAIADKTAGTDYAVSYDYATGRVTIKDLTGEMTSPVSVTYKKAALTSVNAELIIGEQKSDGSVTGIKALNLVYPLLGVVPSMVCAPKWGDDSDVHTALIAAATSISSKFQAMVVASLPTTSAYRTIAAAIAAKTALGMTQDGTLVCWLMAKVGTHLVHASILYIVRQMLVDNANDGLPYETASNKIVEDIKGAYFDADTPATITLESANALNAAGISTIICWGGAWRLWGGHTAAFSDGGVYDERAMFAGNMRMLYYLCNDITLRYWDEIDKPITKNAREAIVTSIQGRLDGLVSAGALCYGKCVLDTSADSGMTDTGRFSVKMSVAATSTPPLQALDVKVAYSNVGLELIFE